MSLAARACKLLLGKSPTLAERLDQRHDNALLLRHLAASMVIGGHSFALAAQAGPWRDPVAWALPGFHAGSFAVCVFFAISGCLLTHSWLRTPNLWKFVKGRIVRIYPGYLVCLLLTVVVLGPSFSALPWRAYFEHEATRTYLLHNLDLAGLRYTLPGVFAENRAPEVVNGSLWSLALEVRLYLVLVVLAALRLLRPGVPMLVIVLAYACATAWGWNNEPVHAQANSALALLFMLFALLGAFARQVPVSTRVMAVLALVAWLLLDTPATTFPSMLAIGYFAVWFAWRMPVIPLRWRGDYSYGIFLYGFPVQQVLLALYPGLSPPALTLLALPCAIVLAAFSWHLVEHPMLRLKQSTSRPLAARA